MPNPACRLADKEPRAGQIRTKYLGTYVLELHRVEYPAWAVGRKTSINLTPFWQHVIPSSHYPTLAELAKIGATTNIQVSKQNQENTQT